MPCRLPTHMLYVDFRQTQHLHPQTLQVEKISAYNGDQLESLQDYKDALAMNPEMHRESLLVRATYSLGDVPYDVFLTIGSGQK